MIQVTFISSGAILFAPTGERFFVREDEIADLVEKLSTHLLRNVPSTEVRGAAV